MLTVEQENEIIWDYFTALAELAIFTFKGPVSEYEIFYFTHLFVECYKI